MDTVPRSAGQETWVLCEHIIGGERSFTESLTQSLTRYVIRLNPPLARWGTYYAHLTDEETDGQRAQIRSPGSHHVESGCRAKLSWNWNLEHLTCLVLYFLLFPEGTDLPKQDQKATPWRKALLLDHCSHLSLGLCSVEAEKMLFHFYCLSSSPFTW